MQQQLKKFCIGVGLLTTLNACNNKAPVAQSESIAGEVLPFPEPPSASTYGESIMDSKHQRRTYPSHLPKDAPNVLIVLMDDVGFGSASTFGGEINTPTLTRIRNEGIAYNGFHTTSICSPTRAALLTGRNHTNVGSGTIAERASDWDGYTGIIPKEAATVAEVLKNYGYMTSAFGKWHNTPANQTTAAGPFQYWPVNYGFQHFYGFLGGETSQWEPALINDFTAIAPPHKENYHLSTDLADNAIEWLQNRKAFAPDKPFLLYYAPGAGHGPHHIFKEWADKYKGKFDDGWDAYRERVFKREKELGWIPANAQLTPRGETQASWESIPETEKPFQRRLMEVFAGFVEHCDVQTGRVIDALEQMGDKENTIVIYIWGDNGSSAEGQNGSISELLAQNGIKNTVQQQIDALNKIGGINELGGHVTENMYHASWAWATNAPMRYTKLVASHFGGTRNPMVISWPKGIKHDNVVRSQFHHVNDIVPTLYDIIGITAPKVVNGFTQMPLDGISMKYTFSNATSPTNKKVQFFDNTASRGIYKDGWYACTFGPLTPWLPGNPDISKWNPENDPWELYNLAEDFTQFNNLAAKYPDKVNELKALFKEEAKKNKDVPIGAGMWTRFHPEDAIGSPYKSWTFSQSTRRMPEFTAPGLGKIGNKVTMDIDVPANANGVLYALGGSGGGLTLFMRNNKLTYEYNSFLIEHTILNTEKITPGKHSIEIVTRVPKPYAPITVAISIDGKPVANGTVKTMVPGAFSATETFDVGADMGSPVSLAYAKQAPFAFNGKINKMKVDLLGYDDMPKK
ncbi:MAG: hypothetical protein RL172_261 [Bacteroidota bacterium]|jgi:arylsulfatase